MPAKATSCGTATATSSSWTGRWLGAIVCASKGFSHQSTGRLGWVQVLCASVGVGIPINSPLQQQKELRTWASTCRTVKLLRGKLLTQVRITNMEPTLRRQCERAIVQQYHDELLAQGVTGYPFEECWREYTVGGLEKVQCVCIVGGRF